MRLSGHNLASGKAACAGAMGQANGRLWLIQFEMAGKSSQEELMGDGFQLPGKSDEISLAFIAGRRPSTSVR